MAITGINKAVTHRIMLQITRILLKKQIVKRIVQIQKTAT